MKNQGNRWIAIFIFGGIFFVSVAALVMTPRDNIWLQALSIMACIFSGLFFARVFQHIINDAAYRLEVALYRLRTGSSLKQALDDLKIDIVGDWYMAEGDE